MRRAFFVFVFAFVAACSRTESRPDATAAPPRADVEPSDAGPPPWPGWPLRAGATITPAMICQVTFASNADLHDPCMREYDPQASMRTYMQQALGDCAVRLERSVLNGRAAIDPAGAEQCVKSMMEIRRSGRAEIATRAHACDGAVIGRQPAGAVCREDWECAPGLGCAGLSTMGPGKCTTPGVDGGACAKGDLHFDARNRACAEGLWCAADRCQPTDKEGALCHPGSCSDGLFCNKGSNRCERALRRADAPCKRSEDCDVGFYCFHSTKAPSTCKAQKRAGEKCLESIECMGDCRGERCVSICGSP
ncbi:MAG: hypothetical protein KIT84_39175 [Labilithrix sp.]|nr:hypothetical protein [Labilithrix sp.]MCW5817084.1 hypothetical protein [Labilithrix sp.]